MNYSQYCRRFSLLSLLLAGSLAAHAQQEDISLLFDIHHILAYIVAACMISIIIMLYLNRVHYFHTKDTANHQRRLNTQLSIILDSNKTRTWTYDIDHDLFTAIVTGEEMEKKYTPMDFLQFYDRDDFRHLLGIISDIVDGKTLTETLAMKNPRPKNDDEPRQYYDVNISVLRRDHGDRPLILLGIQHDVTADREREKLARNMMLRYKTVFNSSQVDMFYYGADGRMKDANDKALETFKITDRQAFLRRGVKFNDIPAYEDMDIKTMEYMHISSITDIDKRKREDERIPETKIKGQFYYEVDLVPVKDEKGENIGVVAAGRDITEMVESFHHQQEAARQLKRSTKDMQSYIDNINYSLKISNVRLVNYDPDNHELIMFSDLNNVQYRLSQIRALTLLIQSERRTARGLMRRMDNRHKDSFSATLCTIFRDDKGRNIYLQFQMTPIVDKDGEVTHYFGMCRNMTEMVYTEQMLQEETAKAQETEQLKSAFLQNMSYELRTPLNAVVGFAELYNAEHSPEDEPVFAEQIKTNTNVLLQLINDILFISRLDARMIEFDLQPNEFASLFDGWCYMGWSALESSAKTIVENPYSGLILNIDQQHLGMVIQKICTYTAYDVQGMTDGMVRAKYEYHHGELTITIEDNGKGLTPEGQAKIFDRFSRDSQGHHQGTGLDLPIVKELLEQMGGSIELQSEQGKGTTFYISLPCEMIYMEKKSEIIA